MTKHIKTKEKKILPAFGKNCVSIVFGSDNNYAKYLSVVIQSIIENSSKKYNYDIIVLHTQIDEKNQNLINRQVAPFSNFSCRFVNVSETISKFDLKANKRLPIETFYRLLIIDLLDSYQKAIYLDSDVIVVDDIANLYQIDISKYCLGACRDSIGVGVIHAWYGFVWRHRFKKLHIINYDNFFNAGVLLMNLSLMRKNSTSKDMLKAVIKNRYTGLDQDALNVFCQNKTLLINDEWNMICHRRHRMEARHMPKKIYAKWKKSLMNPAIYHFAGPKIFKPWLNPFDYPAEYFWKYANKTPFYQSIIDTMLSQTKSKRRKEKMLIKINDYFCNGKND